jgi:hypothetical protein
MKNETKIKKKKKNVFPNKFGQFSKLQTVWLSLSCRACESDGIVGPLIVCQTCHRSGDCNPCLCLRCAGLSSHHHPPGHHPPGHHPPGHLLLFLPSEDSLVASLGVRVADLARGGQLQAARTMPGTASEFVGETLIDGSVVKPHREVCKRWVLRNNGVCAWPRGTFLDFVGGERMSAVSTPLSREVAVGEECELSLTLRPGKENTRMVGYWRLAGPDKVRFGCRLWVDVVVSGGFEDEIECVSVLDDDMDVVMINWKEGEGDGAEVLGVSGGWGRDSTMWREEEPPQTVPAPERHLDLEIGARFVYSGEAFEALIEKCV